MILSADILECFDREVRLDDGERESAYQREQDGGVRRVIGPFPTAPHNWIDHYALDAANTEAAIQRQLDRFHGLRHAFRWKIYSHDRPVGLGEILLRRGFRRLGSSSLLVIDVRRYDATPTPGFHFPVLTEPDELPATMRPVLLAVWPDGADDLIASLQDELRSPGDNVRIVAAQRADRPVGCGLVRFGHSRVFGGLFAGATVPDERGKGVYRGLVAARVLAARQAGVRYLYTEAGAMSSPILRRLGFQEIATITDYVSPEPETDFVGEPAGNASQCG